MVNTKIKLVMFFAAKDGKFYTVRKKRKGKKKKKEEDLELTVTQIMRCLL